jgi:glutamate--cysteine ligase
LPYGHDAVQRYMDFALDAPVILTKGDRHPSFRTMIAEGRATEEMWEAHLSTLFPEVRPREYFEIRSIDAISPNHLPAAVCLVTGIVYSDESALAAAQLLGTPGQDLLVRAGVAGLSDPHFREMASALVELALAGCAALGDSYLTPAHLEEATIFFEQYTFKGRSPADT